MGLHGGTDRTFSPPNTNGLDVYEGLSLVVKYEKTVEDHDGYCSDPGETTTRNETITDRFPLLKLFKNDGNGVDNSIDLNNSVLQCYYNKDCEPHGNGYCGLKTTYTIISATVIRDCEIIRYS